MLGAWLHGGHIVTGKVDVDSALIRANSYINKYRANVSSVCSRGGSGSV